MKQDSISQTALDQMVSNDQYQMLKAAIPYLPPSGRQAISIYTKIQELNNTIRLFSPQNQEIQICSAPSEEPLEMMNDIRRFCYGKSRQTLDQITNMMAIIQMMQLMSDTPNQKG